MWWAIKVSEHRLTYEQILGQQGMVASRSNTEKGDFMSDWGQLKVERNPQRIIGFCSPFYQEHKGNAFTKTVMFPTG